jgi:hypothetical protein
MPEQVLFSRRVPFLFFHIPVDRGRKQEEVCSTASVFFFF